MLIAGVDEVGRGPLAGPVVAAAVILAKKYAIPDITDSKKISAKKREFLSGYIQEKALAWCIAEVSQQEIDKINIHNATLLAMKRAIMGLSAKPEKIIVDGKFCPVLDLPFSNIPLHAIVKGDLLHYEISAASIIAKHYRDSLMLEHDNVYPVYGFKNHMGYPTKQHLGALKKHGVCVLHRKSYAPVKAIIEL